MIKKMEMHAREGKTMDEHQAAKKYIDGVFRVSVRLASDGFTIGLRIFIAFSACSAAFCPVNAFGPMTGTPYGNTRDDGDVVGIRTA